jgi:cellulose biosynthesis protein BcsQ
MYNAINCKTQNMKTIAVTGDKGGVGKSTISALLAQWFTLQNYSVNLLDADPNRTIYTWLEKCKGAGYDFCVAEKDADILIVDTAGTSGSSLIQHVKDADLIIVPFQPHVADLEIVIGWFLSIKESLQKKVVFLPNRKEGTVEQKEGVLQITKILKAEGAGLLLQGINNRPAIYPPILNALSVNYFASIKDTKVIEEISSNFTILKEILYGK